MGSEYLLCYGRLFKFLVFPEKVETCTGKQNLRLPVWRTELEINNIGILYYPP